jgi:hypothetical protein
MAVINRDRMQTILKTAEQLPKNIVLGWAMPLKDIVGIILT